MLTRTLRIVGAGLVLVLAACGDDDGASNQNANQNQNQNGGPICGNGDVEDREECDDGSENSDLAEDACRTDCLLPHCGDGVPDSDEACDDGRQNSDDRPNRCRSDCSFPRCGDGVIDPAYGETCDDGNVLAGDGCSEHCWQESCGNGFIDAGEVCDDGNHEPGDGCSPNCASDESCGNGVLDPGEVCDDGDVVSGDGCSSDCASDESCGNGTLDGAVGETCDDGNADAGDGCGPTCRLEYCGNGVVDPGEVCDDGNGVPGDGCSVDCQSDESCGNGYHDTFVGEQCDDGGLDAGDGCSPVCALEYCGNGVVDPGEVCDDGNYEPADGCSADCRSLETCGNGYVDTAVGEQCDDGAAVPGDGCGPTCLLEYCGNGYLDPGEVCDDRNHVSGDGCSADCTSDEACGNWSLDAGEACDDGNALSHDGCSSGCTIETRQWVQVQPLVSPPARLRYGMDYDSLRQRIVIQGGMSTPTGMQRNDLWYFDGVTWETVTPAALPPVSGSHAMFYDRFFDLVVCYAMETPYRETWAFDGTSWAMTPSPVTGYPARGATGAYAINQQMGVSFGGALSSNQEIWSNGNWTSQGNLPGISPRNLAAITYDPTSQQMVMFGGYNGSVWLTDVHLGGVGGWTSGPAPDGAALQEGSIAPDVARGTVILFVGDQTWEFDGATWTLLDLPQHPAARWGQRMAYDVARDRIVLFGGGLPTQAVVSDTWEYRWQSDWPDESCLTPVDDDGDGLVNCADPDCDRRPCATGICTAGVCQ